ncbi:helix-turn-helix domain-containing protein [Kordiimonas lacus]|uniref:DNA-binding transcriptional regulator, XRE-family HTH domain n=1 Tax=Kordiimonas lacus TaxID=637679 RepID=A0A1G6XMD0_9PROT|nr:helix-turn-helix transcriptional regulator [Kordiimonas lacus]SDD78575.1 DNA-binding transcriptional regulator, XRE-family HTH domain [Kordiimonas lacus]
MDMFKKNIGLRIKALRMSLGFSQEDLAAQIERSVHSISQIERGVNAPSLETAVKIAEALNCSLDDLVHADISRSAKSGVRSNAEVQIWATLQGLTDRELEAAGAAIKAFASVRDG